MRGVALAIVLAVSAGCVGQSTAYPSSVDGESFGFTTTRGDQLPADNFNAFYASTMEALGVDRTALTVSVGVGSYGSLVTIVSVEGVDASRYVETLASAIDPLAGPLNRQIGGRLVYQLPGPSGRGWLVLVPSGFSVYVLESDDFSRLSVLVGAVPQPR